MKRRILFVLSAIIALAIFFTARVAASWRPQLVHQSFSKSETFLISPTARWMLCNGSLDNQKTLIDLRANRSVNLPVKGKLLKFTDNENAAFFQSFVNSHAVLSLYDLPSGKLRQSYHLPERIYGLSDVRFSADGTRLIAAKSENILEWDAKTGQLLGQRSYNLDDYPFMNCAVIDESFSFFTTSSEGILNRDGSLVMGGNKTFSTATGEEVATQVSQTKTRPITRFDVNQAQNFIRVTDKRSGEVVLLEDSLESHYSRDERWLLNIESKGVIQLIDTKNWQVIARRNITDYQDYSLDLAPNYLLTTDNKGRVYRWRLH